MFHKITVSPPTIIPVIAGIFCIGLLDFTHKIISGPKQAPNPAQAYDTIDNMVLSGFHASKTTTNPTITIIILFIVTVLFTIFKSLVNTEETTNN